MSSQPSLTFAVIDAFDPQGPPTRRLCPLCGTDKPRDSAHRCLSLDRTTGLWKCFRCGAAGKVEEKWEERSSRNALYLARRNLRETFSLTSPQLPLSDSSMRDSVSWRGASDGNQSPPELCLPNQEPRSEAGTGSITDQVSTPWNWRSAWEGSSQIAGTLGEKYFSGRALSRSATAHTQTRFCPSWSGRASVVFPLTNRAGELVAVQGRAVSGSAKRTFGPKKEGAFFASIEVAGQLFGPLDACVPAIILVEAPIDALSLVSCGFPALALCGTTGPSWLHIACGLRRVLLAFDADDAGDSASEKLAAELERFGAQCERLRPDGFKDWNDALQSGLDELADWLALQVLSCEC